MKILKQEYSIIIGIIASIFIFLLQQSGILQLGKFINQFYPCIDNPYYAAPCYAVYDFGLFCALALGVFVLVLLMCIRTFEFYRDKP